MVGVCVPSLTGTKTPSVETRNAKENGVTAGRAEADGEGGDRLERGSGRRTPGGRRGRETRAAPHVQPRAGGEGVGARRARSRHTCPCQALGGHHGPRRGRVYRVSW